MSIAIWPLNDVNPFGQLKFTHAKPYGSNLDGRLAPFTKRLLEIVFVFDGKRFTRTAAAADIERKAPGNAAKRCNELEPDGAVSGACSPGDSVARYSIRISDSDHLQNGIR